MITAMDLVTATDMITITDIFTVTYMITVKTIVRDSIIRIEYMEVYGNECIDFFFFIS